MFSSHPPLLTLGSNCAQVVSRDSVAPKCRKCNNNKISDTWNMKQDIYIYTQLQQQQLNKIKERRIKKKNYIEWWSFQPYLHLSSAFGWAVVCNTSTYVSHLPVLRRFFHRNIARRQTIFTLKNISLILSFSLFSTTSPSSFCVSLFYYSFGGFLLLHFFLCCTSTQKSFITFVKAQMVQLCVLCVCV